MKAGSVLELCADGGEPQLAQECLVVTVYDDVAAGKRAVQLVSHLSSKHGDVQFQTRPWRLDLFDNPGFEGSAAADVMLADLVIVAVSNPVDLPQSVRTWLPGALARKRGSNAAVVALFGNTGQHESPGSERLQFVENAAKNAGLDFFAPGPASNGLASFNYSSRFPEMEMPIPLFVEADSAATQLREWGIND